MKQKTHYLEKVVLPPGTVSRQNITSNWEEYHIYLLSTSMYLH